MLGLELKKDLKEFFETPTEEQEVMKEQFKVSFITKLHSKDNEMSTHRALWKIIIANIFIASSCQSIILYLPKHITAVKFSGTYAYSQHSYHRRTGTGFEAGRGEYGIYTTEWYSIHHVGPFASIPTTVTDIVVGSLPLFAR